MKFPKLFQDFIRLGITGWCIEILFTACNSMRRREMALKGTTSLWMFPIYGTGALIGPLSHVLKRYSTAFRGIIYMLLIFAVEFLSGRFLTNHKICPWNYAKSGWNIREVIRLDYAPWWFLTGLLFERMTAPKEIG